MPEIQPQNHKTEHTCSASVGHSTIRCRYCTHQCIKYGKTKTGRQRFQCKSCKKTCFAIYGLPKLPDHLNEQVILLLKEGCGIRSIARILKISASTVIRRILKIGSLTEPPAIKTEQIFELDELCSYVGSKASPVWIAYAINRSTKQVVAFNIGNRSNQMLSEVTGLLLRIHPIKMYTDKLIHYKSLIPSPLHCTRKFGINHIERKNLTLRTHLKRLNRKTICFSRSLAMLRACLMIYFFA